MTPDTLPERLRDCARRVAHAEAEALLDEAAAAYDRLLLLWIGQLAKSARLEHERDELRAMLLKMVEESWTVDDIVKARKLCGLPDFPPITEAVAELRQAVGHHFDGVDPVAFVKELRGDD